MFKHILVPLDGSRESEKAVPIAASLAKVFTARMTLMAVVEATQAPETAGSQARVPTPEEQAAADEARRQADEARQGYAAYLREIESRLKNAGASVSSQVRQGRPAEEIERVARDRGSVLIVMLSRRDPSLARGILGSVTDRVLRTGTVPVLVAHPETSLTSDGWGARHILAPLDLSQISSRAVPVAVSLAKAFNAELRFLRVTPQVLYPALAVGLPYPANVQLGGALRDEAMRSLEAVIEEARKEGVAATGDAATGSPASVIIQVADGLPDCLIVMSTHGLGGLQRMVLGSVTDKVVRGTGRAVLVIPPREP
ncbi:MAG: universal stress protein [Chloroflexi bacterium]|nr:universal stress protein [Chloroflexota bacterium]